MKIAIIGVGFSGATATAHLVRAAQTPVELFLIAPMHDARGVAYGTGQTVHLLNMRARNMGAFEGDGKHFSRWLESGPGKTAAAARGLPAYGEQDFVPRLLYGDYLHAIWEETQLIATQKSHLLKLVPTRAVAIQSRLEGLAVLTERGDAIAVDRAIIATGLELKPALPQLEALAVIQSPWTEGVLGKAAIGDGPVVLIGTGLTAVDMMLSLRAHGYDGQIIAISRRGLLPGAHVVPPGEYVVDEAALLAQPTPSALMRYIRRCVAEHKKAGGQWPAVIDALRPYTQKLWLKRDVQQQRSFLRHALPYWNTHRHRMAPEIARKLDEEILSGKLRILACRHLQATMENGRARLDISAHGDKEKTLHPSAIINCVGPELNLQRAGQPLLRQLFAERLAEPHANGLGLAVDPQYRVFGEAYPKIYALGSLMVGQLLESTAVPELRAQAASVARQILG